MGLYNMIFGHNDSAGEILPALGLTPSDIGRYRDCWVTPEGEIAVYTRMGGGNRECWCKDGQEHECYQPQIQALQSHPLYLRDEDDGYDRTYATFYFRAPDSIPDEYPRGASGDERWAALFKAMENKKPQ